MLSFRGHLMSFLRWLWCFACTSTMFNKTCKVSCRLWRGPRSNLGEPVQGVQIVGGGGGGPPKMKSVGKTARWLEQREKPGELLKHECLWQSWWPEPSIKILRKQSLYFVICRSKIFPTSLRCRRTATKRCRKNIQSVYSDGVFVTLFSYDRV